MNKATILSGIVIASMLVGASTTFALSEDNASAWISYSPGTQKGGGAINPARTDPAEALGPTDGVFVSLGYGGELVLEFPMLMSGSLAIAVQEVTGGPYNEELADVSVSPDGSTWFSVGQASNELGTGDGISELLVDAVRCFQYVKIVDATDPELHGASSDGFDVDSVLASYDEECQTEPPPPPPKPGPTIVINANEGIAVSHVEANANTGLNEATGARGGDGGSGGDVERSGDDNTGGRGGDGGDAIGEGSGAYISTGNAQAEAGAMSVVNTNTTRVNRSDCYCGGLVLVANANRGAALSGVHADANTGLNRATGAAGGGAEAEHEPGIYLLGEPEQKPPPQKPHYSDGGDGGDVERSGDDNVGGAGGSGGDAAEGATVVTGHALSRAGAISMVNTNETRIVRTGSTPMIIYR